MFPPKPVFLLSFFLSLFFSPQLSFFILLPPAFFLYSFPLRFLSFFLVFPSAKYLVFSLSYKFCILPRFRVTLYSPLSSFYKPVIASIVRSSKNFRLLFIILIFINIIFFLCNLFHYLIGFLCVLWVLKKKYELI